MGGLRTAGWAALAVVAAAAAACAPHGAPGAGAVDVAVITALGNSFEAVWVGEVSGSGGAGAGGGGGGQSMVDGMGVTARMQPAGRGGHIIHGPAGLPGEMEAARPYLQLPPSTGYVAFVDEGDRRQVVPVPAFWRDYAYAGGSAVPAAARANMLGYSESREFPGAGAAMSVSQSASGGITVEGRGRAIIKLDDVGAVPVVVTGALPEGGHARFATSPYDNLASGGPDRMEFHHQRGFLISHLRGVDPGPGSLDVRMGADPDSVQTAVFEYDMERVLTLYHGKCCKGRYAWTQSHHQAHEVQLVVEQGDEYRVARGDGAGLEPFGGAQPRPPGSRLLHVGPTAYANLDHRIYDTLPVSSFLAARSAHGQFEHKVAWRAGTAYMVVDHPLGGTTSVRMHAAPAGQGMLSVSGLPAGTPYAVMNGGGAVQAGLVGVGGRVDVAGPAAVTHLDGAGGRLVLYPDSARHSGPVDGTVMYDRLNGQVVALGGAGRQAYTAAAYVRIPVTGEVEVSGAGLDGARGALGLGYLDGLYPGGGYLHVPVVPSYSVIRMEVNGVPASLAYRDVVSVAPVKIADPVRVTVGHHTPGSFARAAESTAGTVLTVPVPHDGDLKITFDGLVSASAEVHNSRWRLHVPPPPPPPPPQPPPGDPLTVWIDAWRNGERVDLDPGPGASLRVYYDDGPAESHEESDAGRFTSYTARFSYDPVAVGQQVALPVSAGDVVEVYAYVQIRAEGGVPPPLPDSAELTRGGSFTATAVLEYAVWLASM